MQHLQIDLPLEIRADATDTGDGRTLEGRIVPYDTEIAIGDSRELFTRGVFADTVPTDVVLLWQHDQTEPIGRMTALTDSDDGAHGIFRLADTARAREALSLITDGITRGLSVGFTSIQTRNLKGVRQHIKARLLETSLVTFPAYPSAGVLAVREEDRMEETSDVVEIVAETTESDTGQIAELESRIDDQFREVRNQIANITTGPVLPAPPMTLHAALASVLRMVAENPAQNRALVDVIGTGTGNAEGLIHNAWISELVGYLNALRPLFSAAGTVGFPASGYGITFPKIVQHTQVSKRTGEKTAIASRELQVASGSFNMEWFAGGVDVSLELISQSDPSVVEVVVSSLMDQYAVATETEFAADTLAAATVGGAVLSFANWGAFSGAVIGASADIRAATGVPGDRLALTSASWESLVKLLNPAAPATLPSSAPDFTAESLNLYGVVAFHAPVLTADVQFNTKSLRKAEKPPETVTATNVALMGRDIGILGATIAAPFYPAGIVKYTAT